MWDLIQKQILGMQWLNDLLGDLLTKMGLDISGRLGASFLFFIYDVIKIVILLCVLIFMISFIQSYFPPERSKKIMARFKGVRANTMAALLGTVTPFCSCSSIPLFIGFSSAGLPLGVTFSFLISSPMVDLGSLVLLATVFGTKIALVYVVMGLVIAVLGGSFIEKLQMESQIEDIVKQTRMIDIDQPHFTIRDRLDFSIQQVKETLRKVSPYILLGVGVGAGIHNWIPQTLVEKILGGSNPFGVVLATLVGAPMYGDIFGAIPISEALLAKGALLGTVLSFMMAVTILSLPSLIMLRKAIKPKLLSLFILICVTGIILVGYFFNIFSHIFI